MPSNIELLLRGVIAQRKAALAPTMNDSDFFELFCAIEMLKSYDLDLDEIQRGIMGGGGDGGIDGIYTFVDGEPLGSADDLPAHTRDLNIELIVFQAKSSAAFSGTAIDKLISTVTTVFDLNRSGSDLENRYREPLLERVTAFRDVYRSAFSRIGRLTVRFVYLSTASYLHRSLSDQADTLRLTAERLFPGAIVSVEFVGAAQLLELARTSRPDWLDLKMRKARSS